MALLTSVFIFAPVVSCAIILALVETSAAVRFLGSDVISLIACETLICSGIEAELISVRSIF